MVCERGTGHKERLIKNGTNNKKELCWVYSKQPEDKKQQYNGYTVKMAQA